MLDLKLGRTYSDWGMHYVLMKTEVPESDPKYQEGYRLLGSNGHYYRPNGTSDGGTDLNEDVTDKVSQLVGEEGRVVETQEEASKLSLDRPYPGTPHGAIQWKGTGVCIDLHCRCGYHSHLDTEFMYYFECPACHRTYACSPIIELIEYKGPSAQRSVQPKLGDDGMVDEENFHHLNS